MDIGKKKRVIIVEPEPVEAPERPAREPRKAPVPVPGRGDRGLLDAHPGGEA